MTKTKTKPKKSKQKKADVEEEDMKISDMKIDKTALKEMYIKEELNKLFVLPPDYDAEMEMLKYQYDHEEEVRMGLHASAVTGASKGKFCMRENLVDILYMEFKQKGKKVPRPIQKLHDKKAIRERKHPTGLLRIFEEGKSIGTKWQRLFIRGQLGVKENMDVLRFNDDYDLIYTPDGRITLDGKEYVVEIKSQNTFGFKKSKSHPGGMKQLKLYMYLENVKRGFVLVEDKNDQDFKIYYAENVTAEDKDVSIYLDLMDQLQHEKSKTLKTKKLPECNCGKCLQ